MILTCPSCSKRFMLDAAALGAGRKVKCGYCRHVWFQPPPPPDHPAHPSRMTPPPPPPPPPPPEFTFPPAEEEFGMGRSSRFADLLADDDGGGGMGGGMSDPTAEEEPVWPRRRSSGPTVPAKPEPPKTKARLKAAAPWIGLAAAVAGVGVGLVQGRDALVAIWPAANGFYELVGMPVEPLGAGLEPVYTAEYREVEGNPMLFVSGEIRNTSTRERDVPDLVVTVIDPEGRRGPSWTVTPSARRLSPNQAATFTSIQPEGEVKAKEIALDFQAPAGSAAGTTGH